MSGAIFAVFLSSLISFFAQMPASNTLKLHNYSVGTGGGTSTSGGTYQVEGLTGGTSGQTTIGGGVNTNPGGQQTQQANVPGAPSLLNSGNWYDKLHFIIDTGNNPSDTVFAIAISSDNFATTNYIQDDNTIGPTLGAEDYQTYTLWGGSSGEDVVGLTPGTTYKIKVKAKQGDFTESAFSAVATQATVNPSLSFDIDVSASNTETASPYATNFGSLLAGTVTDSPQKVWFDLDTNANNGGNIYLYSQYGGLRSASAANGAGYTIASATASLDSASEGFGAVSQSATQTSGGPISAVSPYTSSGNSVGIINSSIRQAYTTSAAIVGGRTSFLFKARSNTLTPQASDYSETVTAIAAGNF